MNEQSRIELHEKWIEKSEDFTLIYPAVKHPPSAYIFVIGSEEGPVAIQVPLMPPELLETEAREMFIGLLHSSIKAAIGIEKWRNSQTGEPE